MRMILLSVVLACALFSGCKSASPGRYSFQASIPNIWNDNAPAGEHFDFKMEVDR